MGAKRRPYNILQLHRTPHLALLVSAAALAAGSLNGCAPSAEEDSYLARKALLERQNQGIRELIDEQKLGSLVPTGRFLIGVSESVIGDLFRTQLPLDMPLGKRLEIHLDSASVLLRDKFAVVTIEGNVHRRATPDRRSAVRLTGGLRSVDIDPNTQRLRLRIAIDDIELLEAGMLEGVLGRGAKKFLSKKARPLLEDALPKLEIPVTLGRSIPIPALQEEAVSLDSVKVPLDLEVERVIAAGGKLWITIDADVGTITGAEEGLGVKVKKKPRKGTSK
jgi:hypothetical protein